MLVAKLDGKYLVIDGIQQTSRAINNPTSEGEFVARKGDKIISEIWRSTFVCSVASRAISLALEMEGFRISFHKYYNCD